MTNATATRRLPIPKRCPVVVIHLRADNDRNGNPRRCFLILDQQGRHVETLDEGYSGEGELHARYPWTSWHELRALGVEEPAALTSYPTPIDVPPSEYRRQLRREPDERCEGLRAMAERNARRHAKRDHR